MTVVPARYDTIFSGDCPSAGSDQAQISIEANERKTCNITKVFSNLAAVAPPDDQGPTEEQLPAGDSQPDKK